MKPNDRLQPGYYPGFSTLSQQQAWDAAARKTIQQRMTRSLEIRFFTPEEVPLITAIFDHILPQDDRDPQFKIPIAPVVDDRLFHNRIDGYRYEGMPPDPEAYRQGMHAIAATAKSAYGREFLELTHIKQDQLLRSLHDGKPIGARHLWEKLPVHRFWMLLVQDACEAYYSHPWSWDEIGFGGPAYPRAYMRMERGEPEPWEVKEQRYEWTAPSDSVSDVYELVSGHDLHSAQPGQGGTH